MTGAVCSFKRWTNSYQTVGQPIVQPEPCVLQWLYPLGKVKLDTVSTLTFNECRPQVLYRVLDAAGNVGVAPVTD